jgi:transmembrane sensor
MHHISRREVRSLFPNSFKENKTLQQFKFMTHKDHLLERFLKKKATPEELLELYRMLNEEHDPFAENVAEEIYNLKDIPEDVVLKVQNLFNDVIAGKIGLEKETPEIIPINRSSVRVWWSAAAAAVIGIGLAWYGFKENTTSEELAALQTPPDTVITISSGNAAKFVVLPDKSTVLLNENSSITYTRRYGADTREVTLTGEGFFDVSHNPFTPFQVRTGRLVTTVLGTAFNIKVVKSPSGGDKFTVSVSRGKVAVKDDKQSYGVLTPNEQVDVNTDSNVYVRSKVRAEIATAWTNKFIIINDLRFEDAIAAVAARFKVKITLDNADLKNCRINATFVDEHQLKDVLTALTMLTNASWTMNNGSVTINGGGCK